MLHVVTTGAYYPPVVTTWKILTTGASQLTAGSLCTVQAIGAFLTYTMSVEFNNQFLEKFKSKNIFDGESESPLQFSSFVIIPSWDSVLDKGPIGLKVLAIWK